MSAREDILARIRAALGTAPAEVTPSEREVTPSEREVTPGVREVTPGVREVGASVPMSGYRTTSGLTERELVDLLVDRLEDYKARVEVVGPADLPEAIRTRLEGKTFVAPAGLPADWLHPSLAERRATDSPEEPLGVDRLDAIDAVVTGSAVSIAETGTIVLDGSADQGRRAISLVPDHHVCVVPVETIVGIVPEGFARLDITRPLTLISGPSATSDIELERVEGVHGPRTLDVLIVR
ncbi:L-lactate dehydrogenase complex protein LldG [Sinomonas atrocyanea]|uniref:LutC/YkgG family protein n=1 Tax=Sinomonas atrocyanea TaxID=37927 RepID=UPI00278B5A04|nr:lactate utilization protein C [Sinomonas atrocyanea]MDP9885052.1 L-lactate dehydrogenase complex protein LldG [Sinomonas atrocyanea]